MTRPVHTPELIIPEESQTPKVEKDSLWRKLGRFAGKAGREVCHKALCLWYASQDARTPTWARRTALGAVAYFILPVDAVPDLLPGVGFVDDMTALTAAVGMIAAYVTPEMKRRADDQLTTWFGRQ